MRKATAPTSQFLRQRAPFSADGYRDPRARILGIARPKPAYRSAQKVAQTCHLSVRFAVYGVILRLAERTTHCTRDAGDVA